MMREAIAADELLRRSHAIGQYYGFTPFPAFAAFAAREATTQKQPEKQNGDAPAELSGLTLDPTAQAIATFLKQARARGAVPSAHAPLFFWHTNVTPGRSPPRRILVQFHAIGSDRAIADAVVIRALVALARDLWREEPVVRINSMGDKETRARYARELNNFFRKHAGSLPEECIERARHDALEAAELAIARDCAEDLPAPTDHLSDASRKRFEDVLDFLEATGTPYELSRGLISRGGAWSETCFEIAVAGRRAAWGSRYGELARHFFAAPMPATGGVLSLVSTGAAPVRAAATRVHFSFVHIGDEAKRLALGLAEEFKRARVPLAQDIGIESLSEQLRYAERRGSAYLLIMGRKEALERSAVLRNRATQEELVLPIEGIAERLKTFV